MDIPDYHCVTNTFIKSSTEKQRIYTALLNTKTFHSRINNDFDDNLVKQVDLNVPKSQPINKLHSTRTSNSHYKISFDRSFFN